MLQIPLPAKEALKTAFAMALTCGIAMGLGWMNPCWACLAVAVVSQPTVGQSINKSLLRLAGTLAGGAAGLLFFCLFPQDRWAFIACVAFHMGLTAYKITVSRYVYFWFISSFVVGIIATTVGTSALNTFQIAVLRVQETSLGILVYALVSMFLWPQRSTPDLDLMLKSILGVQAKILDHYFSLMLRPNDADSAESLYSLEAQLIGRLKRDLDAAETEQFEIREIRGWWRRLISQFQALMETLEVWRESFPELRQMDLEALLPDLPAFRKALRLRFEQLRVMVDAVPTQQEPAPLQLTVDRERLQSLSPLQRAAVLTTHGAQEQIEAISRSLFDCLLTIKNPRRAKTLPPGNPAPCVTRRPDPDSFAAGIRVLVGVWLSALAWIFFDPPGHIMFIVFTGVHSLIGIMTPQMDWRKFFLANATGVFFTGLLYVFVLPSLSGYLGLPLLLFSFTAVIYYIFWDPRAMMLRFAGIIPFVMLTNLQNHQTYDFVTFANNGAGMLLSILLAAAVSNIPFSQRPEKMFLRVAARYFRQTRQFLSLVEADSPPKKRERRMAAVLSTMQASVGKIGGWARGVDYRTIPANSPEKATALVASLNTITYRCMMLADARKQPQTHSGCFDADLRAWSAAIGAALRIWTEHPFHTDAAVGLHARLQTELACLENRIEKTFQAISNARAHEDYADTYRLLGGYRGLYEALVAHAALAAGFDWESWRESRF